MFINDQTFYINPLKTEYTLTHYILEESIFDFSNVRLNDTDIPEEKWLNYLQTVEILIRRRVLRRLIGVCSVSQLPVFGSPVFSGLTLFYTCSMYIILYIFIM